MRDSGEKKWQGAALHRYSQRTADTAARFCFCPSLFHFGQMCQKWDSSCWSIIFPTVFAWKNTTWGQQLYPHFSPAWLWNCATDIHQSLASSNMVIFLHVTLTDIRSWYKKMSPLNDLIIPFQRYLTFNTVQFISKENECLASSPCLTSPGSRWKQSSCLSSILLIMLLHFIFMYIFFSPKSALIWEKLPFDKLHSHLEFVSWIQ